MIKGKFEKAIHLFDDYNSRDPNILLWEGREYPSEYFYSLKVYGWVRKLNPQANEYLLLASRAQHIGRWEIPRSSYPMNKAGYLNWRAQLAKYHAGKAAELLKEAGYLEDEVNQVEKIILKQQIKSDPDVQTMENALCLVFLEFQYDEFISKHEDGKIIRIIQKTWAKMSDPGRQAALALDYSGRGLELIKKALG